MAARDHGTGWCFCEHCETLFVGLMAARHIHLCPGRPASADGFYGEQVELPIRFAGVVDGALVDRSELRKITEAMDEVKARGREWFEDAQRAELEGL